MSTEKKKMLRGEMYDSMDETLVAERRYARHLLAELNRVPDGDMDGYHRLRKQLFPNAAEDFWVERPFFCDYGYNLYVGSNTFFNYNCVVLDVCRVSVGSNVMLGPAVQIYAATHPMSADERRVGLEFGKPVSIGDDCWIGGGAIICPGTHVGAGSVIGAGSVVTDDVPDGVFIAGNPARVIRQL
jgi:maltose O-acetyltransferase